MLRLIGLTFDVCDTHAFKAGKPKKEMDYYGIEKTPNLLEVASFVYFPASFLAGPQFSYHLYERFMNKEFAQFVSCAVYSLWCSATFIIKVACKSQNHSHYYISDSVGRAAF